MAKGSKQNAKSRKQKGKRDQNTTMTVTTEKNISETGQLSFDQTLPMELVVEILKHADQPGLYNLALLSKTLNQIALPLYITNCDDTYKDGKLAVSFAQSTALPALRIALYITDLESVSCSINSMSPTATRLRNLGRLFSRIERVNEVSLDGGLPKWMLPISRTESNTLNHALSELLDGLYDKSCTRLTVNCWESEGQKECDPRPLSSLQYFTCRSLCLFFTIFRKWTITTINTSPITELILTQYKLPGYYWTTILPLFASRTLEHLIINTENLKADDLYPFLLRHPQLAELVLIQPLVVSSTRPKMKADALPGLTTLMAHPEAVRHILASRGACPNLKEVAIGLEKTRVQENAEKELTSDLAALDACLSLLSRRDNVHKLTLSFSTLTQVVDWFIVGGRPGNKRKDVERSLVHVTELVVRPSDPMSHLRKIDTLTFQYLRLFPSLKVCEVWHLISDQSESVFLNAMMEVHPNLEILYIDEQGITRH